MQTFLTLVHKNNYPFYLNLSACNKLIVNTKLKSRTDLRKTPSTPGMPMPSTISLVSLKGTVSGVGKIRPLSNAMPEIGKEKLKIHS